MYGRPSLQAVRPAIRMESTVGFAAIAVEAAARSREFAPRARLAILNPPNLAYRPLRPREFVRRSHSVESLMKALPRFRICPGRAPVLSPAARG